jgi:co-chaperonin GroES (HSP10)
MAYRRTTLADLAAGRGNVSRIIMESGQAQADSARRGGEGWANAFGNISQQLGGALQASAAEGRQKSVQDAVSLATRNQYPSATKPATGAADVSDPGSDHMATILDRLSPEDRPLAIKGIQEIQAYGAKVQEHNLTIHELQGKLKDAETKRKGVAADYGAGLGKQISEWLPKQDGGLSAALFGLGNAKSMGTEGIEEIEPVLHGLSQEWEAAKASGDPAAMQAAAEKNRQTIGPIAQKLTMRGTPEWQEKNKPEAGVALPETGLVNPRTGAVIAAGPGKKETRTIPEQIAAAMLAGDDATVAKLTEAQRVASAASRDPEVAASRRDAAAARNAARFDTQTNHSYEYNDKKLEARAKPIIDQAARFDRLVTTVNEKTAQADALIAPELLTVMAGGAGSGLRINEAEIKNVKGGRSGWANIEAAIQHWVPGQALQVTDDQRAEIGKLLAHFRDRLNAKTSAIEEARGALIEAKDVTAHRRILADLDKKLGDVGKNDGDGGTPAGKKNPFRK